MLKFEKDFKNHKYRFASSDIDKYLVKITNQLTSTKMSKNEVFSGVIVKGNNKSASSSIGESIVFTTPTVFVVNVSNYAIIENDNVMMYKPEKKDKTTKEA